MNHLVAAQAGAQFASLVALSALATWYVVPWLSRQPRASALVPLLWVHVFRYVALQLFSSQRGGFPISDSGAMEIVAGDVGGAIIAFAAIVLLRRNAFAGVVVCWLLVAETLYDTVSNITGGVREHLMGAASGVTWAILVFFVPAVVVSAALLAWQLVVRRGESVSMAAPRTNHRAPDPTSELQTKGSEW
jgi:hypothetical protein